MSVEKNAYHTYIAEINIRPSRDEWTIIMLELSGG